MLALWRNEIRTNLPFFALAVFFPVAALVWDVLADAPNMRPLAMTFKDYIGMTNWWLRIAFLGAMVVAARVLVREHDDGTMEFLDSLPVSRSRIFLVKVTAAFLVLLLMTALHMGSAVLLHALSRDSLDGGFRIRLLVTAGTLRICQILVFLSVGLAASFLRRFGWLVIGVAYWGFLLIRQSRPDVELLNLFDLVEPHIEGNRWVVP